MAGIRRLAALAIGAADMPPKANKFDITCRMRWPWRGAQCHVMAAVAKGVQDFAAGAEPSDDFALLAWTHL
ncbi:hypothetical protein [Immundisolibacter sp.]